MFSARWDEVSCEDPESDIVTLGLSISDAELGVETSLLLESGSDA